MGVRCWNFCCYFVKSRVKVFFVLWKWGLFGCDLFGGWFGVLEFSLMGGIVVYRFAFMVSCGLW